MTCDIRHNLMMDCNENCLRAETIFKCRIREWEPMAMEKMAVSLEEDKADSAKKIAG
ncbi:MAG: hypothetical protein ABI476_05200 [Oxalobacteraceae bacterium]